MSVPVYVSFLQFGFWRVIIVGIIQLNGRAPEKRFFIGRAEGEFNKKNRSGASSLFFMMKLFLADIIELCRLESNKLFLLDPVESTNTSHSFHQCNPETLQFSEKKL